MATVYGNGLSETIDVLDGVTNSHDIILAYGGDDVIFALGGNDIINGGAGADTIHGGSGNDTATYIFTDGSQGVVVSLESGQGWGATAEGDTLISIENLTGSNNADILEGDGNANVLLGLDGNDKLKGGGGADTLNGSDGDDVLEGGAGADELIGGFGIDTASYVESAGAVTVQLATNYGDGGDAEGDTYQGIENITGSSYADTLVGNGVANVLRGGLGDDMLKGAGGADTLWGGGGSDTLLGGTGNDTMIGGADDDIYYVDSISDVLIETAGQGGADLVLASTTYAMAAGVEIELLATAEQNGTTAIDLAGNEFSQTIQGNNGTNVLSGLGSGDLIDGLGGDDHLFGGAGADLLVGGSGNDTFVFAPGEAHGDVVVDFIGNGDGAGDLLVFQGYGPGATFTQVDNSHWLVNYNGGASHDLITFHNGGANGVHPSDVLFV